MSLTLYHLRYLMETNQDITVLFIDGDQEDRRAWAEAFKRSSPESVVLEAHSGAAGLAVCRSQRVDCVIVEMSLPDMSGFQVLVDLIPYHQRPTVAVIMFTRLPLPPMATSHPKRGAGFSDEISHIDRSTQYCRSRRHRHDRRFRRGPSIGP